MKTYSIRLRKIYSLNYLTYISDTNDSLTYCCWYWNKLFNRLAQTSYSNLGFVW